MGYIQCNSKKLHKYIRMWWLGFIGIICVVIYIFYFRQEVSLEEVLETSFICGWVNACKEDSEQRPPMSDQVSPGVDQPVSSKEGEDADNSDSLPENTDSLPENTEDNIPAEPPGDTPSDAPKPNLKKFKEGDANWKFIDISPNGNLDCWNEWTHSDGKEYSKSISTKVAKPNNSILSDGRYWCPVDRVQPPSSQMQDKPFNMSNMIKDNVGSIIGLAGAVGIGLTEELILKSMKKSTQEAAEMALRKTAAEASDKLLAEAGDKFVKNLQKDIAKNLDDLLSNQAYKKLSANAKKEALEKTYASLVDTVQKKLSAELNEKLMKEVLEEAAQKANTSLSKEVGERILIKAQNDIAKELSDKIALKVLQSQQDVLAKIAATRLALDNLDGGFKLAGRKILDRMLMRTNTRIQNEISNTISTTIMSTVINSTDNVFRSMTSKIAKETVDGLVTRSVTVISAKVFFRSQAVKFMGILKSIRGSYDDMIKMTATVTQLGTKMGRNAFRGTLSKSLKKAFTYARSIRPGPMALFDIVSFALDMADVGGYAGFMTTKDYEKAVNKANLEFRAAIMEEMKKSEMYAEMPDFESKVDYPLVLDPTSDAEPDDIAEDIKQKVELLFALSSTLQPHPAIHKFIDAINTDIANNKFNPETDNVDKYVELIDMDSIQEVVARDTCIKMGGQQWTDSNGDSRCTHTSDNCRKLYSWPLKEGDTYAEWVNNRCVLSNPEVRSMCDQMGARWENDKCVLDTRWCQSKGGEVSSDGSCKIPLTQKVVEFIFGTSVTRLSKEVGNQTIRPGIDLANAIATGGKTIVYEGSIRSGKDKTMCLDIGTGPYPSRVTLQKCNSGNTQLFRHNPVSGDIRAHNITSNGRGICLENPYGKGGRVWSNECNGEIEQSWTYDEANKIIRSRSNPDRWAMDHNNASTAAGTEINLIAPNGDNALFEMDTKMEKTEHEFINMRVAGSAANVLMPGIGGELVNAIASTSMVLFSTLTGVTDALKSLASIGRINCRQGQLP